MERDWYAGLAPKRMNARISMGRGGVQVIGPTDSEMIQALMAEAIPTSPCKTIYRRETNE